MEGSRLMMNDPSVGILFSEHDDANDCGQRLRKNFSQYERDLAM